MTNTAVPETVLELPPSPDNPRNSEGSFVALRDRRVMFAYSRFYGGAADDSPSRVAARVSADRGRTWSGDATLVENTALNTMSVSFLRLQSGRIALLCLLRVRAEGDVQRLDVLLRTSSDEAATWSDPVLCSGLPSYYVVNNDRMIQLASGRLVIPTADHGTFDGHRIGVGRALCFLSDDEGQTWRHSTRVPVPADFGEAHLQEPLVVELQDGRLLMLCRTTLHCQYRCWSEDGGETWSEAEPTELLSPCSPASLKRLPSTGDLLLVYNDHRGIPAELAGKRTPLVSFLSSDEGQTWQHRRVLEDDPDGWFCYTALLCDEDQVLMGYCAGNRELGGLNRLRIKRVPVSWLYGQ